MNRDVFLSLLALDAYKRGYGPNVGNMPNSSQIGNATILRDADDSDEIAQAAGFYAIAYNWNGETVISFPGTNFTPVGA